MSTNLKIIQSISNINGINVSIQSIKKGWIEMDTENRLRQEITYSLYLKFGIVNRELVELRRIANGDQHLNKVLATLEPFTRELDHYSKGIKTYRDRYIAHFNRGNGNSYQPVSNILTPTLTLPRSNAEIEVLMISVRFLSDMLIGFYWPDWRAFEKDMLDDMERPVLEYSKAFVPRTPVDFKNYVDEVNRLAVTNGFMQSGQTLIRFV